MRTFVDVYDAILKVIPNEEHYHEILDKVYQSACYRAPELQGIDWMNLSRAVSGIVDITPETDFENIEDWRLDAVRILMDMKTVDDVKKMHYEERKKS